VKSFLILTLKNLKNFEIKCQNSIGLSNSLTQQKVDVSLVNPFNTHPESFNGIRRASTNKSMKALEHFGVSYPFYHLILILIVNMANARKLFRLFKSLLEYKKINMLLGKADSMALHKLILTLIPRIAFFFFWMFDHLVILTKIGVLKGWDQKWIMWRWAMCWTIANWVSIIGAVVELCEINKEEAKFIA
jgi:hypothetical protein